LIEIFIKKSSTMKTEGACPPTVRNRFASLLAAKKIETAKYQDNRNRSIIQEKSGSDWVKAACVPLWAAFIRYRDLVEKPSSKPWFRFSSRFLTLIGYIDQSVVLPHENKSSRPDQNNPPPTDWPTTNQYSRSKRGSRQNPVDRTGSRSMRPR
jgi:hypothetical protein